MAADVARADFVRILVDDEHVALSPTATVAPRARLETLMRSFAANVLDLGLRMSTVRVLEVPITSATSPSWLDASA